MGKKHLLTVPGLYAEIKKACQFVTQGAIKAGLNETAVFHIELACDEACTNVIEHAYDGEGKGEIGVSWQVVADEFVIEIVDNGRIFDLSHIPTVPETDDLNNIKIGGLGIHFMRKLMDDVAFSSTPQSGNKLVMKKKIKNARLEIGE